MSPNLKSDRYSVNEASDSAPPQEIGVLPPIHTIPPELVGEIFTKCLEDGNIPIYQSAPSVTMKSEISPFTLSYVCRRWRRFALSTPTLWSSISLYEPEIAHIPLVELWLQRASDSPLLIYFVQTGNQEITHHAATEQALALFVQYADRWKDVHFCLQTSYSALLDVLYGGVNMLESAAFIPCFWGPRGGGPYVDRVWSTLHSSPALRRVCWTKGYLPEQAPWKQLTHIEIDSLMEDHEALELLRQCHNIENIAFYRLFLPNTPTEEIAPITLPRLHTLAITCYSDPSPMFQRLVLPVLRCLDIRYTFPPGVPLASPRDLDNLLCRSACQLKKFVLVNQDMDETKLLDYLRLPSIQRISELHISAKVGDTTVQALTTQSDVLTPEILPYLKALHFKMSHTSDRVLSKMVTSRLPYLQTFTTAMHVLSNFCPHDTAFLENLRHLGHDIDFDLVYDQASITTIC